MRDIKKIGDGRYMVKVNAADSSLWGRKPSVRQALVVDLFENLGVVVTRKQVIAYLSSTGRSEDDVHWLFNNRRFRVARGSYTLQPLLLEDGNDSASVQQGAGTLLS